MLKKLFAEELMSVTLKAIKSCRKMPEHGWLIDNAQATWLMAQFQYVVKRFDGVVDMTLRVHPSWYGQPHQFMCRGD